MAEAGTLTLAFVSSHPVDAAKVLERLSVADAAALFTNLPARAAAPVLEAMLSLAAGLLEETRRVGESFGLDCKGLESLGYREMVGFLRGEYDWEEAVRLMKRNTRRYAKRQFTWFRRYEDLKWFAPDAFAEMDAYSGGLLP